MPEDKAQASAKTEHTRSYVSILGRVDEPFNFHKKKCEIPLQRGNAVFGHKTHSQSQF